MRLWHEKLLPYLDRQRLLSQHRECAALRGKSWGRKHATVDYVFTHVPERLVAYHWRVMDEMELRGYHPDPIWNDHRYRGKELGMQEDTEDPDKYPWADIDIVGSWYNYNGNIYDEHNEAYLKECIELLKEKGAECDWEGINTLMLTEGIEL